jgi:predicted metal-dependent phosphoesterase TrpH
VERPKVSPADATEIITKAHGVPVLAHPFTVAEPEKMIADLKGHGLLGVEVYYGSYSRSQVAHLRGYAQKYSLLPTGGSDFHGIDETNEVEMGQCGMPMKAARALIAFAERKPKTP